MCQTFPSFNLFMFTEEDGLLPVIMKTEKKIKQLKQLKQLKQGSYSPHEKKFPGFSKISYSFSLTNLLNIFIFTLI